MSATPASRGLPVTVNRLSMTQPGHSVSHFHSEWMLTAESGRTSSRFPIRCLHAAHGNPRNSTPLPAYDACYAIECGFHCADDYAPPPIQMTIIGSGLASAPPSHTASISPHLSFLLLFPHFFSFSLFLTSAYHYSRKFIKRWTV